VRVWKSSLGLIVDSSSQAPPVEFSWVSVAEQISRSWISNLDPSKSSGGLPLKFTRSVRDLRFSRPLNWIDPLIHAHLQEALSPDGRRRLGCGFLPLAADEINARHFHTEVRDRLHANSRN
jgi:hypothetical protein